MSDTRSYLPGFPILGQTFGGYKFVEEIARGGMGIVYRGYDEKLDRDVALKVLYPHLASDATFTRQFVKEARALARLRHTNIVAVYAVQETEFGNFIAMEFVKGISLAERIRRKGKLSHEETFRLFTQILQALEHAHKAGVLHRDLKPGNILIDDENQAKITDFGLAKIQRAGTATVTHIAGGSLFYCPPEQLDGMGEVDQRGDIYSAGMTMYEALVGTVPFEDTDSDFRIREKIVNGKIRPAIQLRPDLPPCLNDIVMKAIAQKPERRFQTATEMRVALAACHEKHRRMPEPRPAKSMPWVQILAAGAILVLALAGYYFWPRSIPTPEPAINAQSPPKSTVAEKEATRKTGESTVAVPAPEPNLEVRSPAEGAVWTVGKEDEVSWKSQGFKGNVHISLSTDGGVSFPVTIAPNTVNDGIQVVRVPDCPSRACRIKVESSAKAELHALNPGLFVISSAAKPRPSGSLVVSVQPEDATVSLTREGREVGTWQGRSRLSDLPAGDYDLKVVAQGYSPVSRRLVIQEGKAASEHIVLKRSSLPSISRKQEPQDHSAMLLVEGGTFMMGRTSGRLQESVPHSVTVSPYYIETAEVTVARYRVFCNATGRAFPPAPPWGWQDDGPMVNVSWEDATAFAKWAGKRLPTEAEWEYAARGGGQSRKYTYSGSNDPNPVAWYVRNSDRRTHPVSTKKPNELGIYDMSGNVWEWCSDWYGPYRSVAQSNPKGPTTGRYRVVRGGSWLGDADYQGVVFRNYFDPFAKSDNGGFRCARDR